MRLIVAIVVSLLPAVASGQDVRPKRAEVDATIDRGLGFLVKDALAWKTDHNCASCHHAALVICAMREAKQFGHAVDEPVLAELTKWIGESGDGKFGLARPASAPKAASPKAIYFALALGTDPKPEAASVKGLTLLLKTVEAEQTENGSWSTWPGTRPPLFGSSDESLTALATLAVLPSAATGDEPAKAARDKGVKWLAETKTDNDPQSIALRLVLWKRLGRPAKEWEPLVKSIKDRQNPDGGWSQTIDMASDAWATGQALYALAQAGIRPNEAAVARGQNFLIKTQRKDGSWSMTSRPTTPGGKGSTSLIPITGAGSAWAVLGLVRSTTQAEPGATPEFLDSNGVKIRFITAGKGEAVVLLHGLTGRAESWGENPVRAAKTMPELAKSYRVIALDCRGHGQSEKPHDPKKYGREMIDDVLRLLDHLKIKKAHVVGSSMGAWVAGTLLVTHPDRLLSVTLVGGGPWFEPSKEFVASTNALIQGLEQGRIQSPFFKGQDQKAMAALLRGVQETPVTEAQLKANKVPALVVYGSKDGDAADQKRLRRIATLLGAEVKVIDGADHMGMEAAPEFLETVLAFIKNHKQ